MKIFFISDLHFGHKNCLKFDRRPWDTIEEMDEELIRRWNRKVRPEDHVYVLGDFAYKNKAPVNEYTERLNGFIHLIRGNHDKHSEEYESCFCEAEDYKELKIEVNNVSCRLILSHYFIPFYRGARHMTFMLHGHTHMAKESAVEEELKDKIRKNGIRCEAYNVGCMWQNYEPQTFEEILARQDRKIKIIP